jgi:hypothetical protein
MKNKLFRKLIKKVIKEQSRGLDVKIPQKPGYDPSNVSAAGPLNKPKKPLKFKPGQVTRSADPTTIWRVTAIDPEPPSPGETVTNYEAAYCGLWTEENKSLIKPIKDPAGQFVSVVNEMIKKNTSQKVFERKQQKLRGRRYWKNNKILRNLVELHNNAKERI